MCICEAVTCKYNELESFTFGYCTRECQSIRDNGTCRDYEQRQIKSDSVEMK